MCAIRIAARNRKKTESQDLTFTVIYLPVEFEKGRVASRGKAGKRHSTARTAAKSLAGFQVTVPILPGLISFGRTLGEAEEMARDAIECHIEGLRKSGEPVPDERLARRGKLRVALSA